MSGYSRLARNSAARKALLRDLITDLILNGSIKTTVTKANELKRLADKMVTLGKKNTLASRRQAATFVRFEKDAEGNFVPLFCLKCGTRLKEGSTVCEHCGYEYENDPDAKF